MVVVRREGESVDILDVNSYGTLEKLTELLGKNQ